MGNSDWESIRGYIPIIMVFIVAGPVIILQTGRHINQRMKKEETKTT